MQGSAVLCRMGPGQGGCRSGAVMWGCWHRDRAPGDSPARRFHGHPSMRGGLNGPRHNTYPKYVTNTLNISSVSGGQPSR